MTTPTMTTITNAEKNRLFAQAPTLFAKARTLGLISEAAQPSKVRATFSRVGKVQEVHSKNTPKRYAVELVPKVVAEFFDVPEWKLQSRERTGAVATARCCGYKLLRDGGYSWDLAAKAFNRTSPQTAAGGADVIEVKLSMDAGFRERFGRLVALLNERAKVSA